MSELIMGGIMMYMLRSGSRNGVNELRDSEEFRKNYQKLLQLRIPHMDTVNAMLRRIEPAQLDGLLKHLVKILLSKRVFHKFRLLNKYFMIAIDGTGVFKFDKEPYAGCPHKTSKKGKKNYHQPVVEAKLICSNGFSISLYSEWVINEDGQTKQDCEYKATIRLLDKLHGHFPRLPICILMDGLFLKYPIQKQIKEHGWEFIMVWKDKTKYDLQDQIAQRKAQQELQQKAYTEFTNSKTREEYALEYSSEALNNKDIEVYYTQGIKRVISTDRDKHNSTTKFVFMSSIPVDKDNVKAIFTAGRLRWKIENEGFNTQKNSGLALHHKMSRTNLNAMKNYYTCLQIAHLFSQLLILAKNSIAKTYRTAKKLWADFWALLKFLPDYQPVVQKPRYNLRY